MKKPYLIALVATLSFSLYGCQSTPKALSAPKAMVKVDSDDDGLPDWWELKYFGNINADPNVDTNGNGVSNLLEYQEGTDPTLDFYKGVAPTLKVAGGNHQAPIPGEFLRQPWTVRVLDPNGRPWVGAPVRFTATAEEGLLASEPTENAPLSSALTVNADADGYARVWLKCQ